MVAIVLLKTMWRAKKIEISQGSYELFFIMCIYDEKKYMVLLKNKYIFNRIILFLHKSFVATEKNSKSKA
jgi:hypothetical protein